MKPFPTARGSQAPLSNKQKAHLSQMAKQAWTVLKSAGATDETEQEYRQRESIAAVGRRISEALNGDFETLQAHFLAASGRTARAFDSAMRADSNGARQARFKISKLLAKHGADEAYAAKIMRDKFKTTLDAASEKQLWAVFFDCQRGMKARKETTVAMGQAGGRSASSLMQKAAQRFAKTATSADDTILF